MGKKISVDEEKIRTLLKVLVQAEYEFNTSSNLWVTDRPDLVPNEIKFETDFTGISDLISEQIYEWEKLVDNHNHDYSFEVKEEETLKKDLFNFVTRVLKTYAANKGFSEIQILPEMTKILLDYFIVEKN